MPRATYFPKIQNFDTSFYMLGWGVPTFDSQYALQSLIRTRIEKTADGDYNLGRYSNPKVDELTETMSHELDKEKRQELINAAAKIVQEDVATIPLHQQVIVWAVRDNVDVVQPADNAFYLRWVKLK